MSDIIQMLRAQLMADKKKAAVLGALLLVLIVVVVRALSPASSPQPAAADAVVVGSSPAHAGTAGVSAVQPVVQPVQASKGRSPTAPPSATAATVPSTTASTEEARFLELPDVSVAGLPRMLERELFSPPDWSRFEEAILAIQAPASATDAVEAESSGTFWTRWAESMSDIRRVRQEEMNRMNADLVQLELRSTVTGKNCVAHISGQVVRPGDRIRGFSVVRVEERRVILSRSGVQRVLEMP